MALSLRPCLAVWLSPHVSHSHSHFLSLSHRPGDESVSVTDLLDLSSVSVPSTGSSPPPLVPCSQASPSSATNLAGSSPPSSASCLPIEVPSSSGRRLSADPFEPSPPSSHGSLPSTTPTNASASAPASAAASFVSVILDIHSYLAVWRCNS